VNQAWTQKARHISPRELPEAKKAYDHARQVYTQSIDESSNWPANTNRRSAISRKDNKVTKRKLVVRVFTVLLLATLGCVYWLHRRSRVEVSHRTSVDSPASTVAGFSGIAVTKGGDVYISERKLNRVLKISPDGKMSVVAGNGNAIFSGDGGPAISASLAEPVSVALNSSRIRFIADMGNNRVCTVDPKTGFIRTVAGNGTMGGGTGVPALSTGLYARIDCLRQQR
jgi:hypothetical protein